MTSSTDFRLPATALTNPNTETGDNEANVLRSLGVELAYVQNRHGQYQSFYWKDAHNYGLSASRASESTTDIFQPVDRHSYLTQIREVLDSKTPKHLTCLFESGQHVFTFEVIISPLLTDLATASSVLTLGHRIRSVEEFCDTSPLLVRDLMPRNSPPSTSPDYDLLLTRISYPKLLTQIARKIRQTLDLDTIWKQTANGLGSALNVRCCLVYAYDERHAIVKVVAEHRPKQHVREIDRELSLAEHPEFQQAIALKQATIAEQKSETGCRASLLVVATCHQGQVNGAIALVREESEALGENQKASTPLWHPTEIEIVEELAAQVGTAIAHATLYRELEIARQQAEEVSRLKSDFLANTSHELRTPLNGMMGFLKLILDGMADDPEEQLEFIREAYRSAVHLLNIINDILDIAKIEAGKMQLDLEPVNLEELLNHLKDFVQSQVKAKQLYFQVQMPDTEDRIIVYGNYQRLLQVFLNLVGNAIKFTHEGGITITTDIIDRTVTIDDRTLPGMVKVQVADTGIGVSLEKQDKLFQTFSQVDGSRTRQYGGTGLGLVISQKLVEAMGGEVHFYSMGEGLGSTVTFTVPLFQEPVMIPISEILDSLDILLEG
ncbi:MAG: GAF domain-containing protein [Cyanobacteria bacterium SID2]|nr:GAF domain-containing protein [Cyanobacteria bacterium SID2]MBP0003190.1 GAF domain-containing protein [Cyanobacteria bacterium SBC]